PRRPAHKRQTHAGREHRRPRRREARLRGHETARCERTCGRNVFPGAAVLSRLRARMVHARARRVAPHARAHEPTRTAETPSDRPAVEPAGILCSVSMQALCKNGSPESLSGLVTRTLLAPPGSGHTATHDAA